MADGVMTFRLHYNGEFTKNKYLGGSVLTHPEWDLDRFSYSVLMEWVKDDLKYKEIGGVYVRQDMDDGWKLVTDDAALNELTKKRTVDGVDLFIDCDVDKEIAPMKQMQPHVIIRPKKTPIKAKEKNSAVKRKFVTIKDINNEKARMMTRRKKPQFDHTAPSPVEEGISLKVPNYEEMSDHEELMGLGDYLSTQFQESDGDENMSEDEHLAEETVEQGVNKYEQLRNVRVAEVKKKAEELGLTRLSGDLFPKKKDGCKVTTNESDDYCPDNDAERECTDNENMVKSKRTKKDRVVVGTGPRTRSQANKTAVECDKEPNADEVVANDASIVPTIEKLKSLKNKAPGSMTAYLEMRNRQKIQAEAEILQSQSQTQTDNLVAQSDTPTEAKKRKTRGKSKMKHVHTRNEKREIPLNLLGQPVSDDETLLSEFSNFLGTTVRDFVSLTCVSWREVPNKDILWKYVKDKYIIDEEGRDWVMITMRDQFRGHKSNIKKNHYTRYKTDEQRIKNRPREVPLNDFMLLLDYWGDEKVQATAKRNAESRSKVIETHTAGPKSFAQITNKLVIEKPLVDVDDVGVDVVDVNSDAPPAPLSLSSDARVYVATRKRDPERKYKLPTKAVEEKISNIKKILEVRGNVEDANKLVHGGKEHSHSYLVGRVNRKRLSKKKCAAATTTPVSSASSDQLAELTAKIREQLAHEMDEKVNKKVRENVKLMMAKIAEKNPDLKVDMDEISGEPSIDDVSA